MTDGVYDALGEIAPLDEYTRIVEKYDGKILIDDAHGMAVVGKTGKGSWEERDIDRNRFFLNRAGDSILKYSRFLTTHEFTRQGDD